MKYSYSLSEKDFLCGVDKIGSDSFVQDKDDDLLLELGLEPKDSTFTDQTPTPTQFFRNCEEVGLFQDLQNDNPFEETFRKAVEAAKAGQTLPLGEPYHSNPLDDTLHTPNVFPHLTDMPSHLEDCIRHDHFPYCDDSLLKQDSTESWKLCRMDNIDHAIDQHSILNQKEHDNALEAKKVVSPKDKSEKVVSPKNELEKVVSTKNKLEKVVSTKNKLEKVVSTKNKLEKVVSPKNKLEKVVSPKNKLEKVVSPKNKSEKVVVLNEPDTQLLQFIPTEAPPTFQPFEMVIIQNSGNDGVSSSSMAVKEKLKKNLKIKKIGKISQSNDPNSKPSYKKLTASGGLQCSKYAFKFTPQFKKSGAGAKKKSDNANKVNKSKSMRSDKQRPKESRSEFLARSRAAAWRCREKKKMYLKYLESLNRELSMVNAGLQSTNLKLMKEISELHDELKKHENCPVSDENTKTVITRAEGIMNEGIFVLRSTSPMRMRMSVSTKDVGPTGPTMRGFVPEVKIPEYHKRPTLVKKKAKEARKEGNSENGERVNKTANPQVMEHPTSLAFDIAEVVVGGKPKEGCEIPLVDSSKADIITRFNSVGNSLPAKLPSRRNLNRYAQGGGPNVKKIYAEHCYFEMLPMMTVQRKLMIPQPVQETTVRFETIENLRIQPKKIRKCEDFPIILPKRPAIAQRTPPPLILLKPSKKRNVPDITTNQTR